MTYLYIVATPIGNLEDISFRAIRVLTQVDLVLCEDTRVTKKLLNHYNIKTPTISYHQHSGPTKVDQILEFLKQGKNLALVSDSGTPGIADPGNKLIQQVAEALGEEVKIEPIPGPSAVTAALSVSGIPTDKFLFLGFPPHKKGRQKFLQKILLSEYSVVVYESKHRINKFLQELRTKFSEIEKGSQKEKDPCLVICRELSKMHETIYRGNLSQIATKFDPSIQGDKSEYKGEFVVVVDKSSK